MNLIKITPSSTASFDVDLQDTRYTLTFIYNARLGIWTINLLLAGVALATGQAAVMGVQLFRGYADPRIPTGLYLAPLDDSTEDADYAGLGSRVVLMEIFPEDGINVPV
jgi:hypothetical protein